MGSNCKCKKEKNNPDGAIDNKILVKEILKKFQVIDLKRKVEELKIGDWNKWLEEGVKFIE